MHNVFKIGSKISNIKYIVLVYIVSAFFLLL